MANIQFQQMVMVPGIHKLKFLKLEYHHINSSYEKSIVTERATIQHIKDRTDGLMIIFHRRRDANQSIYQNWFNLFDHYNMEIILTLQCR
jgi:hypothetical protein